MKKSELRKIIREEIAKLNELKASDINLDHAFAVATSKDIGTWSSTQIPNLPGSGWIVFTSDDKGAAEDFANREGNKYKAVKYKVLKLTPKLRSKIKR